MRFYSSVTSLVKALSVGLCVCGFSSLAFPALADVSNIAPLASSSTSYVSPWETLGAVNDGNTPLSSNDKTSGAYGNWNNPNSIQWVEYEWSLNYELDSTEVYWFDDNGGVRVPSTAYIEYWSDNQWVFAGDVPTADNTFNALALNGISTHRLRISMLNPDQSTGVLEWRVFGELTNAGNTSSSSAGPDGNDNCDGPLLGTEGSNPILPHVYAADPAVLVHDCTFYITAGHDEGDTGFLLRDWYVLSSQDMVTWNDNGGPVLDLDVFSWANANAWAGQMVERNGRFYWYVPVNEIGGGMAIGVAVADSPTGPFLDAIGGPLINDALEMQDFNYSEASQTVYTIDPTVFVDDDGRAYLAYGGFWRMVIVALGEDMISLSGSMVERTPSDFFEAPYLTKRDGTYYMVYAAGSNPATIDYATSNTPTGPWQYRGRILDALPALPGEDAPTSHASIVQYAGQWYLVYHVSNGPGGGTYRRQVALDKLYFNADGSIQKVTPSSGLQFLGSNSSDGIVSSASSSSSSRSSVGRLLNSFTLEEGGLGFCGVEGTIDSNHAGYTGSGFANTANADGNGIDYAISVPSSGAYVLHFVYGNGGDSVRSANLEVNGQHELSFAFAGTGAWSNWSNSAYVTIILNSGNNRIRLAASNGSGLPNIDSLGIRGSHPGAGDCGAGSSPVSSASSLSSNSVSSASSSLSSSVTLSSSFSSASSGAGLTSNIAPLATASTSYVSPWETLDALNDNSMPANSNDKLSGAYGNWNTPNALEWVAYEWSQNYTLEAVEIYWFDDDGGVLVPTHAYIEYWDGNVWARAGYIPLVEDAFNALGLNGITTDRLRVSMINNEQSTGILEWRVLGRPSSSGTASSNSAVSSSPSSIASGGSLPYQAISNEYSRFDVTTSNALYLDTDRFRAYYGGNDLNGGEGNLANVPESQVAVGLSHLEAAYECFINEWGFRSTSLPAGTDSGPYYKMNIYSTTTLNSAGAMGADAAMGLSFIELKDNAINSPETAVHEFGHSLTYTAYRWMDQVRTGAWWETVANWVADTYNTDPLCENVRVRRGLQRDRNTIINLDANIVLSHLQIVSTQNYYQAWPLLTYLVNNPDGYAGLGRMIVKDLFDNHARNNETPLHVLERIVAPVSVQTILGRYWARMAYLDIGHPKAQAQFLSTRINPSFRARAFGNLEALGGDSYRVKADREPKYGGANITPLSITGDGFVSIQVNNLGNALNDSNFTATLSIRNTSSGDVRYVDIINGDGQANIASGEELSLVVVNTPDNLIQFNAFESTETTDDAIGLRYDVQISGAQPANL